MKPDFVVPPDAAAAQRAAADPRVSAWVSANAGAGKTKVLTDRVIRIMLDGTPPSRILCLTFTKAAAAEMTIRVFETLGNWVTLDDVGLSDALRKLTGEAPKPALLAKARRLFARAVETPGGLKIETIHAFCERLLHLVPFEAQVPARFAVLDDAEAAELMAEARAAVLIEAANAPVLAEALETVASEVSGDALTRLLAAAVADPRLPADDEERVAALARLRSELGLAPGKSAASLRRAMAEEGLAPADARAIAAELDLVGGSTNGKLAASLRLAAGVDDPTERSALLVAAFFTDKGTPTKTLATKAVPEPIRTRLQDEQVRLVALRARLKAADALARTAALWRLAAAIRQLYEAQKRRIGALDFADLIARTSALLDGGAAPWVLYRLDRGIDHVLVDEAQDTNADQWCILKKLTEDFTAGAGRPSRRTRTIFAVGDPKQSIYSFQGAEPRLFEESRRHWDGLHRGADMRFVDVRLALSFRSAPTILDGVDATFSVAAHFRGLSFGDDVATIHGSARPAAPGQIEIWPTQFPTAKADPPDAWSLPVDAPDPGSPALAAAQRVAKAIGQWTREDDPCIGRPWRAGEILILARRRGPAFFAAIRALKAAGIPVAGADRIDINQQIAVNDLVAAGQAAILPSHDLALAAALKSPLVGLDDDDLVRIGADRPDGSSLASALESAAETDPRARDAHAAVSGWREAARRHGPFGFYATLLGPGGGRRRLVARLGGEAADAIDTFLCRAEAEERSLEAHSLTAFLSRFENAEHVIKRDAESRTDEVRVMTVHGAKGLEAPLVVLLDGCEVGGRDPLLIGLPAGGDEAALPVWAPRKDDDPAAVAAAREATRLRALEEHNRLLYVALTRARDRLVVVPYTDGRGREPAPESWAAMVRAGLVHKGIALIPEETPHGPVEALRIGRSEPEALRAAEATAPWDAPDWLHRPMPAEPEVAPPLRPSSALAAADRASVRRPSPVERARRRGILVHALIERLGALPAERRDEAAHRFLAARAPQVDPGERERLAAETLALLAHPELAILFGPDSRGEVAIAGTLGMPERAVSGQIDRLAIGPDTITVADFKTGRPPRDAAPAAYVAQLAVYAALLRETHPGYAVRALLVWPEGLLVMPLGDEALAAALDRVLGVEALVAVP